MKLELGSGDRPTDGFVHLDMREDAPHVDIVGDAATLEMIEDERCDEIRATHLLEHFGRLETVAILRRWRARLKHGGLLYLEVPNLTGHVNQWLSAGSTDQQFVEYLYGEQDHPFNYHKTLFTANTLRNALHDANMQDVVVRDIGLVLTAEAHRGAR